MSFLSDGVTGTTWQGWVGLAARVILGGALLWAGVIKIGNLAQSVVAVRAYRLPLPDWLTSLIGHVMPFAEIVLGAALIAGLFTRWAALLGGLMMVAYIIGLSQAWARGLNIDCGCFSPGGDLSAGQQADFLSPILRDTGLLILAAWLVVRPRAPWSVDAWIAGADHVS